MMSGERRYTTDQDDHCVLTFEGSTWRITGMAGLHAIDLLRLDGVATATLDLSRADLGAYADRAAAWLRPALEISNAEVCP